MNKRLEDVMNTNPQIDVIIPTYNREKMIERAVRSVLEQSYDNINVIVVDDCSTDHTEQIVEKIGDARIKFYKLPQNGGAGHARNEGVKLASAELIAFHDSDDVWRPEKLERQMDYWGKHPEFSMVYCPYLSHRSDGSLSQMPYPGMPGELEGDIFYSLLVRNSIGAPTILLKKECFLECGGFDDSLRCLEDWEFALRFAHKYLIGYVDEVLMDVYRTADSVSSEVGGFFEARCRMVAAYRTELIKAGLFDQVVSDLFAKAECSGALENVKKMLLLLMQNY